MFTRVGQFIPDATSVHTILHQLLNHPFAQQLPPGAHTVAVKLDKKSCHEQHVQQSNDSKNIIFQTPQVIPNIRLMQYHIPHWIQCLTNLRTLRRHPKSQWDIL